MNGKETILAELSTVEANISFDSEVKSTPIESEDTEIEKIGQYETNIDNSLTTESISKKLYSTDISELNNNVSFSKDEKEKSELKTDGIFTMDFTELMKTEPNKNTGESERYDSMIKDIDEMIMPKPKIEISNILNFIISFVQKDSVREFERLEKMIKSGIENVQSKLNPSSSSSELKENKTRNLANISKFEDAIEDLEKLCIRIYITTAKIYRKKYEKNEVALDCCKRSLTVTLPVIDYNEDLSNAQVKHVDSIQKKADDIHVQYEKNVRIELNKSLSEKIDDTLHTKKAEEFKKVTNACNASMKKTESLMERRKKLVAYQNITESVTREIESEEEKKLKEQISKSKEKPGESKSQGHNVILGLRSKLSKLTIKTYCIMAVLVILAISLAVVVALLI